MRERAHQWLQQPKRLYVGGRFVAAAVHSLESFTRLKSVWIHLDGGN